MFSENGRVKDNKEAASVKNISNVVCLDCDSEFNDSKRVFGEKRKCPTCNSTNLQYLTKE